MAGKADHYGSLTMFVNVCNVIVSIVGYLCDPLQGSVSVFTSTLRSNEVSERKK
jgi:hypothetical protein